MSNPNAFPVAGLPVLDQSWGTSGLPEEVRAAIEARRDEIHSEEELRGMAEELMLRR